MHTQSTAFRTDDPKVLEQWSTYLDHRREANERLKQIRADVGRDPIVRTTPMGHHASLIGFSRAEGDATGDLLYDGRLVVSSPRGQHRGRIVPNLRRKSGKALAEEYESAGTSDFDVDGMPTMAFIGIQMARPGFHAEGGYLYACWPGDFSDPERQGPDVGDNWEQVPLSTYHASYERFSADLDEGA